MTRRAHAFPWIVLAALAVSTVACGGSMSATGPSSLSGSGAVISGRVTMSGNAALSISTRAPLALVVLPVAVAVPMAGGAAAGNSVTVTIVGTGASTTLDGNGSFTLDNVPPGSVTLRFQGRGSDALLTISGIEADDHISIAVTLNGNNARLDKRDTENRGNNGVQVNGRIDQIDTANQTLRVNLQTVLVQQATFIRHGNRTFRFSDLRVGDHIQVKGRRDGATFVATEIKVETGDDDDDDVNDDNDVEGAISGLGGTCPSVTFFIGSTKVTTNALTSYEDITCLTLANNQRVEVTGNRANDGSVVATRIERD
jgi:hypothetical protein